MKRSMLTIIMALLFCSIMLATAEQDTPTYDETKPYNEGMAFLRVRDFISCAVDFSNSNAANYFWDDGTTDFSPYFSFVAVKNGYNFKYFGNGKPGKPHDSTRFIFYAYPVSPNTGDVAIFADESCSIFAAVLPNAEAHKQLSSATADWDIEAGTPGVLKVQPSVVFTHDISRFEKHIKIAENERVALKKISAFSDASVNFARKNGGKYWDEGTTDFKPYGKLAAESDGYTFKYFANGEKGEPHDSTRFILLAYPKTEDTGLTAFFCDETRAILASTNITKNKIALLAAAKANWNALPGTSEVLSTSGKITFKTWLKASDAKVPRTPEELVALATVKSFGSAAVDFSNSNAANYFWDDGTTDFGVYFKFAASKDGYNFKYFANGDPGEPHDSTRFIIFAYPQTVLDGTRAYFIDESQALFEAKELTEEQIKYLSEAKPNWDVDCGNKDVLTVHPSVVFMRK